MYGVIWVMLGGALGAALRYMTGLVLASGAQATLVVNVSGSFAMGLLGAIALTRNWPGDQAVWLFLGVGMLGAFTTFSAFSREAVDLLLNEQIVGALVFMVANMLGAILAFWAGFVGLRAVLS